MFFKSSKDLLIKYLQEQLEKKPGTCSACSSKEGIIKYLQEQLALSRTDRREEREEFKRSVDRLIESYGSRPVGQGASPDMSDAKTLTAKDMAGLFEETDELKR